MENGFFGRSARGWYTCLVDSIVDQMHLGIQYRIGMLELQNVIFAQTARIVVCVRVAMFSVSLQHLVIAGLDWHIHVSLYHAAVVVSCVLWAFRKVRVLGLHTTLDNAEKNKSRITRGAREG